MATGSHCCIAITTERTMHSVSILEFQRQLGPLLFTPIFFLAEHLGRERATYKSEESYNRLSFLPRVTNVRRRDWWRETGIRRPVIYASVSRESACAFECASAFTRRDSRNVFLGRVDEARSALWKREREKARRWISREGNRGSEDENTTKSVGERERRKRWIKETAVSGDVFLTTSSHPFPRPPRLRTEPFLSNKLSHPRCRHWRRDSGTIPTLSR